MSIYHKAEAKAAGHDLVGPAVAGQAGQQFHATATMTSSKNDIDILNMLSASPAAGANGKARYIGSSTSPYR
jgi:hypothetical protein